MPCLSLSIYLSRQYLDKSSLGSYSLRQTLDNSVRFRATWNIDRRTVGVTASGSDNCRVDSETQGDNNMFSKMLIPLGAVAALVLTAGPAPAQMSMDRPMPADDIVAVAAGAGTFNTLLAAAEAAGLVEALRAEGPLTVFAPTDEAFAALPDGMVETLLKPENKKKLQAVLLYHVVEGEVASDQVVKLTSARSLQGDMIEIRVDDGTVYVDDARVIKPDVRASNGVIHVIDAVMLPPMD